MNTDALNYKPAKVWKKRDFFYILFYWRPDPVADFTRYKKTYGLNRIADVAARATAAQVMAETVTQCLKEGWNPETDTFNGRPATSRFNSRRLPDLIDEAHTSILKKSNKPRTHTTYESHRRLLIEYLKSVNRYKIDIGTFSRIDAQNYQDDLLSQGLAARTVNTKYEYVQNLFGLIARMGIIKENPFSFTPKVKEHESEYHEIFTRAEIKAIRDHLLAVCPQLWIWSLFIYYCYMRPDSIMSIKAKHIYLSERYLIVPGESHKNGNYARKQLLAPHMAYLEPYLQGLDPDHYLFSRKLQPGTDKAATARASELWNKYVRDDLSIKKTPYGLKPSGAAHFLENNPGRENLIWLQTQMSHADLQTTSIYTNKLKIVKLDERESAVEVF